MASLQEIQSRMRAVSNIGKITKAMEVVSATKMRRAQEIALASRAYALLALNLLEKVRRHAQTPVPFTDSREVKKTLVVLVLSDRGLAGSFNAQVLRKADAALAQAGPMTLLVLGKKGVAYASKKHLPIHASFTRVGEYAMPEEVEPVSRLILEGYAAGKWDRVLTISTHFRTTLLQETLVRQLLPLDVEKIAETVREIVPEHGRYAGMQAGDLRSGRKDGTEYIFEPTPEETLTELVPHLLTMQIYHLVLEANASEHSARRVAMKTASDNAEDLSDSLRLAYNKARQAAITKELIEITSTQTALA